MSNSHDPAVTEKDKQAIDKLVAALDNVVAGGEESQIELELELDYELEKSKVVNG